jgi:hypothetical protein
MMIMMGVHMETNHESSLLFNTLLYAIYIYILYIYICIFVLGSAPLYLKFFSPREVTTLILWRIHFSGLVRNFEESYVKSIAGRGAKRLCHVAVSVS